MGVYVELVSTTSGMATYTKDSGLRDGINFRFKVLAFNFIGDGP